MIQEQAGIEVVAQVDQQSGLPFPDAHELAGVGLLFVLRPAPLPSALFVNDVCFRHPQRFGQRGTHLAEALCGRCLIHPTGRLVLGHVRVVAIDIHCHRVLGHIGIVEPVALDMFAPEPTGQALAIFSNAVGEHDCALAQGGVHRCHGGLRRDLRRHRSPAIVCQVEQQQVCFDSAVVQRIALVGAQPNGSAQRQVRGEDRRLPAGEFT